MRKTMTSCGGQRCCCRDWFSRQIETPSPSRPPGSEQEQDEDEEGADGGTLDLSADDSSLPPLPRPRLSEDHFGGGCGPGATRPHGIASPSSHDDDSDGDGEIYPLDPPPPLAIPSRAATEDDEDEDDDGGVGAGQSLSLSTDIFQHFISPSSSTTSMPATPAFAFPLSHSAEGLEQSLQEAGAEASRVQGGIAAPPPPHCPPVEDSLLLQLQDVEPYLSDKIVMSLWQRLCEVRCQIDRNREYSS
jgi:hypothetical protein